MKKNYIALLVYCICLALLIGIPFTLISLNQLLISDLYTLVFYIVSKVLFGISFIAFAIYGFYKKMARGMYFSLAISTITLQFIPLIIRCGVFLEAFKYVFVPLILALSLICYLVFVGTIFKLNKKQLASDTIYKGSTIEIKDER